MCCRHTNFNLDGKYVKKQSLLVDECVHILYHFVTIETDVIIVVLTCWNVSLRH